MFSISHLLGIATLLFPLAYAQTVYPAIVGSRRAELEAELKQYEKQIGEYQDLIERKREEGNSLKRDIDILSAEIAKAKLEIKARTLAISKLGGEISQKAVNIKTLEAQIEQARFALSVFLRKLKETDGISVVELALIYNNLSQFFDEIESAKNLQSSMQDALANFASLKSTEEDVKEDLEGRREEETELKNLQEIQKKSLEKAERDKQKLLKDTRGKESEYQKILKDRQKNAANIRSQLFLLTGSAAIPFEKALEYANFAERATGVRPAFLLGLITEESNLGQNVGKGNWKIDLAHARCAKQRAVFLEITSKLGLDPDLLPVSKKVWYGYCGGAMGPAQFMPVTWQLYEARISKVTGSNPPSPWEPKDAFVAAALLLKDNGAVYGNYNAEWKAAMKYLAGANWNKSAYRFYGDDVMAIAAKYQEQIDLLKSLAQR